jgi:Protein of unknown function (DUF3302)
MGDPLLNYFALFLLIFVVVVLFYAFIAIHDIPYKIADSREHPHQDAIHAVGWASLFTLHALWPFLWIWAMAYRPERGWGFAAPARSRDWRAAFDRNRFAGLAASNRGNREQAQGRSTILELLLILIYDRSATSFSSSSEYPSINGPSRPRRWAGSLASRRCC